MQIPVWHGRVADDGRLTLDSMEATDRQRYLRGLIGKAVDVVVRVHRKKRSVDQNAWLWGPAYEVLGETLGYDVHEHEQMHYAILAEYFGTVYDPRSGMTFPARTSSQLNTKEFSTYMDWLVRWAATEHGAVIPLPDESEAA